MSRPIPDVDRHVERMLAVAKVRRPDFERDCLSDPGRLTSHWGQEYGLRFEYVDNLAQGAGIDPNTVVDDAEIADLSGLFTPALPPKRLNRIQVRYRIGDYTARRNFTLLHEIGHYLQQTDDQLVDVLCRFASGYEEKLFEETACNRFASLALLPTSYVRDIIGDGRLTSATVNDMFERERHGRGKDLRLSRPVVVRRMAEFLQPGGTIALLTDGALIRTHWNGDVDYAERRDDPLAWLTDAERHVYDEFLSLSPRNGTLEQDVRGEFGDTVHVSVTISYGKTPYYFIVTAH